MATGSRGLSRILEESRQRRDQASQLYEALHKPKVQEEKPRPLQQEQRRSSSTQPRLQVQHTDSVRPDTSVNEISGGIHPVYNPEDATKFYQESNTVGFMGGPQVRMENLPPLPPTLPVTNPVADLKNKTALSNQYTPDAQRRLNQQPTTVNYGLGNRNPYGALGLYTTYEDDPKGQILIENIPGENQRTLAHEFAHAWENNYMPPVQHQAWQTLAPQIATDYAKERVTRDYKEPANEREMYATATEQGPWSIPPSLRNDYYDMYRQDIKVPQPPGLQMGSHTSVAPPYIDGLMSFQGRFQPFQPLHSDKGDPFSTEYWVKEYEAPLGYYEDGSAVRSPVPFPSQWNPPQFPSLSDYEKWVSYPRG